VLNGLLHTWDKDGGGTFNAGRYANPRLDAVRSERDPETRRTLLSTALKLPGDDIADIPLHRRALTWAMQKKVHVAMSPDDTIAVRRVVVKSSVRASTGG